MLQMIMGSYVEDKNYTNVSRQAYLAALDNVTHLYDEHAEADALVEAIAHLVSKAEALYEIRPEAVNEDGLLNLLGDIDYVSSGGSSEPIRYIYSLTDKNTKTAITIQECPHEKFSWLRLDFKEGISVRLDRVRMHPRDNHPWAATRLDGTIIQGSHNGVDWTTLTEQVAGSVVGDVINSWCEPNVIDRSAYRYLRIANPHNKQSKLHFSELEIYGEHGNLTT